MSKKTEAMTPESIDLGRQGWLDGAAPSLWQAAIRSHAEYVALASAGAGLLSQRRDLEARLASLLPEGAEAVLPGYCSACRAYKLFQYDHRHSQVGEVNWRERLVCPDCRLNNRLRLSAHLFESLSCENPSEIYVTESLTPFAELIGRRYPGAVTSEYLGCDYSPGEIGKMGVRHEDVTGLSFGGSTFQCVLTFDVLEHVPNYRAALAEFWRVLKPGGVLLLSAPFVVSAKENIVRARATESGNIEHLLEPEYHGDPINPGNGILCYYHFGWELVEDLRSVGFQDACVKLFWSLGFGYIGAEQLMVVAIK